MSLYARLSWLIAEGVGHYASLLHVAVDCVGREGREADGDVLGALLFGRAVLHPLAAPRDDGLARAHVERLVLRLHAQQAAQDDGVLHPLAAPRDDGLA